MTNLDIEKIGTQLVIEFEKQQGREILRQKYKGCGWDLCTGNKNETRFIEIKTSRSKKLKGRWIEKCGFEHLQNNSHFWVYSVTECQENGSGIVKPYKGSNLKYKEEIKYILSFD